MNKIFSDTEGLKIARVADDRQLDEILQLQKSNLAISLDEPEIKEQGFVTVQHDLATLKEMHAESPSIIAVHDGHVVGYALIMPASFRSKIPILEPMFALIDDLTYLGLPLASYSYFVMGQVCIAKHYRGQGIFDKLYEGLRHECAGKYRLLITEVARRNQRSVKAHLRVGLKVIHQYTDPAGEEWELMAWDWQNDSDRKERSSIPNH